jgi:hypothetical protein
MTKTWNLVTRSSFAAAAAFVSTLIFAGVPAQADTFSPSLIEITSDAFPDQVFHLGTVTDAQGDLKGFHYSQDSESAEMMSLGELRSGVNLVRKFRVNILTLRLDAGFSPQHGGRIEMRYVTNAIRGRRSSFYMDFVREGASWRAYEVEWSWTEQQYQRARRPFTQMDFVPARFGVARIDVR